MVEVLLRIVGLFSIPLRWLGVDSHLLRAILKVRFKLDDRRNRVGYQQSTSNESSSYLRRIVLVYLFFGLMMGIMLASLASLFLALTVIYGFMLAVLGLALIADLSTVLIDTTDLPILRPRPIDGRTLLAARILHLFFYLGLLGLSLGAVTIIVGFFKVGPFFPIPFIAGIFATILFAFAAAQFLYSVGMDVLGSQRFREVVGYLQAGLTVLMIVLYLGITRLMDVDLSKVLTLDSAPWLHYVPPAWLAGMVAELSGKGFPGAGTLAVTAGGVTLLALILLFRFAGPRFDRQLDRLEFGGDQRKKKPKAGGAVPATGVALVEKRERRRIGVARWLAPDPQERAAYRLTATLMRRERGFRMRTLPMLGIIVVYAGWFLLNEDKSIAQTLSELPGTSRHLIVLYMAQFFMITPLMNMRFARNWRASWVYRALPFQRPGLILMGAFKALIVRLVLPMYLVLAFGIVLPIWGLRVLPDIVFAGIAGVVVLLIMSQLPGLHYPFAEEFSAKEASGRTGAVFFFLLIPAGVGLLHAFLRTRLPIAVWIAGVLLLVVLYLAGKTYRATTDRKMGFSG